MPPRRRDDDAGGGGGGGGGAQQQQQHVQAVHRLAFVQHLMRHGCLPEDDAKEAFRRLTGFTDDDRYRRMVADQNREMAPLGLQIRAAACPTDAARRRWVGLANADADAPARQFGSRYSVQEREFFRATMELIAADEGARDGAGSASSMALLNLDVRPTIQQTQTQTQDQSQQQTQTQTQQPPHMTKAQKEAALRRLVADGWLCHARAAGHYALGARTFLELGHQLVELPCVPEHTREAWRELI